jgi:hypothetical protein
MFVEQDEQLPIVERGLDALDRSVEHSIDYQVMKD